jgi:hypothetical protein
MEVKPVRNHSHGGVDLGCSASAGQLTTQGNGLCFTLIVWCGDVSSRHA